VPQAEVAPFLPHLLKAGLSERGKDFSGPE